MPMPVKTFFLWFFIGFTLQSGTSQSNVPHVQISYFGVLGTHPGIKVGIQYPVATLNGLSSEKQLHQIIASPNVIVYFHRRNHLGVGAQLQVGYQMRQLRGINVDVMAGVGYLRTIIPNTVYDFDETGGPVRKKWLGTGHFLKTAGLGLGKTIGSSVDSDFWMIRPTLLQISPYGTGDILNMAIDAGYYFP